MQTLLLGGARKGYGMYRTVLGGASLLLALAVVFSGMPAAEATSKMNPQRPIHSSWGVKGKTFRNNSCGAVICAYEHVSLARSSWTGYRVIRGSQNYRVGSRSVAYSNRKCRSGTYRYQTRHKQKVYINGTIGLSIKGTGGTISVTRTQWVETRSPVTLRASKNSRYCENGRRY